MSGLIWALRTVKSFIIAVVIFWKILRLTYYICVLTRLKEGTFLELEVKITPQCQFKFKL